MPQIVWGTDISAGLDELAINTDRLTPRAVAERVLQHIALRPG